METLVLLTTSRTAETSEYDYRVLYLSGVWTKPGGYEFRFRATILVQRHGAAEGSIYWRAVKLRGIPKCHFGTESVKGSLCGANVELQGSSTDPGLAVDWYKIYLVGAGEAGTFGGKSACNERDWRGSMEGQYVFRNRKG